MKNAEEKRRELVLFDIEPEKQKKSAGTSSGRASGTARSKSTSSKTSAKTGTKASSAKTGTKTGTKASSAKTGTKTGTKAASGKTSVKAGMKAASAKTGTKTGTKAAPAKTVTGKHAAKSPARQEIAENPAALRANRRARRKSVAPQVRDRAEPPKKRRRKKRARLGLADILMLSFLIAFCAVGAWRVSEYRNFKDMKSLVATGDFYEGTLVEGVDVSQMTLQEAVDYWDNNIEPAYRNVQVQLSDGTTATAEELGYQSTYQEVLTTAWSAGRTGTLEERYTALTSRGEATGYTVTRQMYTDSAVRAFADQVGEKTDTAATSAQITSFNMTTYAFEFSEGTSGCLLDREALVRDVEAALEAGGGSVELATETIPPEQTTEDISAQYGLISYAITNASSSSRNRLSNIELALSIINGTCLEPGQTFSFNETVGKRTTERGFKTATAYSSGEVTEQVGGGICQVSTTLFNAAVKADLQIDERHAHSLTVSYVDLGKDAAVDWGNKDLKFTNTSSDKIYICCYLTDNGRIRFGIFGRLLPNGETIVVEGKDTGTIDYDTEYVLNFTLPSGAQQVTQKGKNGHTATTYKVRLDANGNEISREELCTSRYQATKEIIEYGQ